jgi:hypothetical protein
MHTQHEIQRLANAITDTLGQGWAIDPDYDSSHSAMLTGPKEARLHLDLSLLQRTGKLRIEGTFPETSKVLDRHEIGVSHHRGPDVVARSIRTRLLPGYTKELAAVLAYNLKADAAKERRRKAAADLAAILPACQGPEHFPSRSLLNFRTPSGDCGRVDLFSDVCGGIEILSTSVNLLRRIAAVLRDS